MDVRANWYLENGRELVWAVRSIAYLLREKFDKEFPQESHDLWVKGYRVGNDREELTKKMQQVAINNMADIDREFEELNINDLADKAFALSQCWFPAIYHCDPIEAKIDTYLASKKNR